MVIQTLFHTRMPSQWHWFALLGPLIVIIEIFALVARLADGNNEVKVSFCVTLHQHVTPNNLVLVICVRTDSAAVNFATPVAAKPLDPAATRRVMD